MSTPWTATTAPDGTPVLSRAWSDLLGQHHEEVVHHGLHTHPAVALAARLGTDQHALGAIVLHAHQGRTAWEIQGADGTRSRIAIGDRDLAVTVASIGASSIAPASVGDWAWREHQRQVALRHS